MSNRVITINRMFGSNGRIIGKALAEELGFKFYDKELIEMASREKNIPFDEFARVDERKASQWLYPVDYELQMNPEYHFVPMNDVLFDLQRKIILDAAEKEDCVIVGRCANHILDNKCLSVFIHAPFEYRVQTVIERTGREEKSAQKLVKKVDKERRTYYEYFTDKKWKDISQYHLAFDSSKFDFLKIRYICMRKQNLHWTRLPNMTKMMMRYRMTAVMEMTVLMAQPCQERMRSRSRKTRSQV